jgi:hypothetical protein
MFFSLDFNILLFYKQHDCWSHIDRSLSKAVFMAGSKVVLVLTERRGKEKIAAEN